MTDTNSGTDSVLTNHAQAERLRLEATAALTGYDRDGFLIRNPTEQATMYAAMAVAAELADVTDRLIGLDVDVARIATAAEERAVRPALDFTETELAVVRGEISRTDTKASILLASVAILAAPLAGFSGVLLRQPWPVAAVGIAGAVLAGAAAWLLLDVVLPRLHTRTSFSGNSAFDFLFQTRQTAGTTATFLNYAQAADSEGVRAAVRMADRHAELGALSRIAAAKFGSLSTAGRLLKAAGLLLAVTAVLAVAF